MFGDCSTAWRHRPADSAALLAPQDVCGAFADAGVEAEPYPETLPPLVDPACRFFPGSPGDCARAKLAGRLPPGPGPASGPLYQVTSAAREQHALAALRGSAPAPPPARPAANPLASAPPTDVPRDKAMTALLRQRRACENIVCLRDVDAKLAGMATSITYLQLQEDSTARLRG